MKHEFMSEAGSPYSVDLGAYSRQVVFQIFQFNRPSELKADVVIRQEDVLPVVRAILQEAGVDAWVVEKTDLSKVAAFQVDSRYPSLSIVDDGGDVWSAEGARSRARRYLAAADEAERLQKEAEEVDVEDMDVVVEMADDQINRAEARLILRALMARGWTPPKESD